MIICNRFVTFWGFEYMSQNTKDQKARSNLLKLWRQNIKDWIWYQQEHPERFTLDIQGAVRKVFRRCKAHLQKVTARFHHVARAKKAKHFPEAKRPVMQFILFIWGCLPFFSSRFAERITARNKRRSFAGGRIRGWFEKIKVRPAIFLGGALGIAAIGVVLSLYTLGTTVVYDGNSLGTVSSHRTANQAVGHLEEVTRETLKDDKYAIDASLLSCHYEITPRRDVLDADTFEDVLTDAVGAIDYGYMLYVDGEPVVATPFSGALEELLEQLKIGYISEDTVDCHFVEDVDIREQYMDASYVMNLGYIAQLLNDTKQSEVSYTVKKGDTYYGIADKYDLTLKELLKLNPGYNVKSLHVGDVLTVSNAVSYLTVVNVERQNYVSNIPFKVKYKKDSSMYEGDYKVLSAGKYGKADVTADVTYINGEETERNIVKSTTLKRPVTEIRAKGTKERPTWLPTGSFRWPCTGSLTSHFGYRNTGIPGASTFHEGIDIANGYGTPIYASDGGTVSYAGWMGGYGYLVIINHGNGYETYYGHNSSLHVSVGDHVFKGQQIASMGSTGVSSGCHCDFRIKLNGTFLNPLNYI